MTRNRRGYCYEIAWTNKVHVFTIGYCWSLKKHPNFVELGDPFTTTYFWSEFGAVRCRANWPHDRIIPSGPFRILRVRTRPWMFIHFDDLYAAETLIDEISIDLPPEGFLRAF